MARNVFISFRYADGIEYKNKLSSLFDAYYDTVDFSEDKNRSMMSEETIRQYLYGKLRRASVTIIILTPLAINHNRDWRGQYDDWIYDEIRYSLENRVGNRTNGIVAVYTPEAEPYLISGKENGAVSIRDVDNLFRKNMMNVKEQYKLNSNPNIYDRDYDSYCSLISWSTFVSDMGRYVDIAFRKRDEVDKYNIVKRL